MFYDCQSMKSIDVSNFDVSKVTTTESMFQYCSSLTSLDLSKFKTPDCQNMASMFGNCGNLQYLNGQLWKFTISKCRRFSN